MLIMEKTRKKKNRVYSIEGDPDYGCIYVAARTSKDAKTFGFGTWVAEHLDNPFIEMRVLWQRGVETDYEGELDIDQINELGLSWWACEKCDKENFEIVDTYHYKCKNCNHIGEIPYID